MLVDQFFKDVGKRFKFINTFSNDMKLYSYKDRLTLIFSFNEFDQEFTVGRPRHGTIYREKYERNFDVLIIKLDKMLEKMEKQKVSSKIKYAAKKKEREKKRLDAITNGVISTKNLIERVLLEKKINFKSSKLSVLIKDTFIPIRFDFRDEDVTLHIAGRYEKLPHKIADPSNILIKSILSIIDYFHTTKFDNILLKD